MNALGKQGEQIAEQYLINQNYNIVARNLQSSHLEIDLIAQKNDTLAIVEVKTRQTNFFGNPENAVNKSKQKNLFKATQQFLETYKNTNPKLEIRFDIIAITINNKQKNIDIQHFKDAFHYQPQT